MNFLVVIQRPSRGRRLAVMALAVLAATMVIRPEAAPASGTINTSAQGLRVHLGLLGGQVNVGAPASPTTWATGSPARSTVGSTLSLAGQSAANIALLSTLLQSGAVNTYAEPANAGGRARSTIASLNVLAGAINVGTIDTGCLMDAQNITATANIANLRVGGLTVNPAVNASASVAGLATVGVNKRYATWDDDSGRLEFSVHALDIGLLNAALPGLADGTVTVAESTCSGIVQLGDLTTTPVQLVPGQAGTPTVTVRNTGDVAAPNTVIRVPVPPAGYALGTPSVTGGGSCTVTGSVVTCAGVTVPGGGTVTVSLPVTLAAGAGAATADWKPDPIDVVSTPVAEVTGTTIPLSGTGMLAGVLAPSAGADLSRGVSLTSATATPGGAQVTPTVRIFNAGAAAATATTITVPAPPAGYTAGAVTTTGGGTCTTTGGIRCTGVTVPASGSVTVAMPVTVNAATTAGWTAAAGTPVTATSGSATGSAAGTLVTAAPRHTLDVDITGPATGTVAPGQTATMEVDVANLGPSDARGATFVVVAPPLTTIGPLSGSTATACTLLTPATARCTLDLAARGPATRLSLPLAVSLLADPAVLIVGGCISLDNDAACSGPLDEPLPGIGLPGTSLDDLVTIGGGASTIVPGGTAPAIVRVTAVAPVPGTTVTIPLSGLPDGLDADAVTGPAGASCTLAGGQARCTGVDLVTGVNPVTVTVSAGDDAGADDEWRVTGISVAAGPDVVTGAALLLTVSATPDVTFTVTGPDTVAPGGTATLTITGANRGTAASGPGTTVVVAPGGTSFGDLSGATAQACTATSSTVLTCDYDIAAGGTVTWTVPLEVDGGVRNGEHLADGCVSTDGDHRCDGPLDIAIDDIVVSAPLAEHGTLTAGSVVIEPGGSDSTTVTVSADLDYEGLALAVPLDTLPDGFTVDEAELDGDGCTTDEDAVSCTGVDLAANTPRTLRLTVGVAESVPADTVWRATGITLVNPDDEADRLTATGVLVSTSASAYVVTVTVGALSDPEPVPGGTTVLPITVSNAGPGDADPYPLSVVLPDGTTHGTLPAGCAEDLSDTVVTCPVPLAAGASASIDLPIVLDVDLEPGSTVTGGCVDEALGTGAPEHDQTCGGDADVAIPDFTVGRFEVNLAVTYGGPAVDFSGGARPLVQVPYANEGTVMADDVWFTVELPAGVTVAAASILLDDAPAEEGAAAEVRAADTVDTTCRTATGSGGNMVACSAPDAAGQTGSELWLTLVLGDGVEPGEHRMRVTISTASDDGDSTDNTVEVPLVVTAADDGDGGDGGGGGLPVTGADVTRLVLLSLILLGSGLVLIYGMPRPHAARHARRGRHRL